jgi:uncharacterized membrane protein
MRLTTNEASGRRVMQKGSARTVFLVVVTCAAIFVWVTSRALPDVAASHFGGSGTANGFMPRDFYAWFMLLFVVVLPVILVFVPSISLRKPNAGLRLPNRDYWLAPERQAGTAEYLRQHMARFGSMLVVFLCYIHWLVVHANTLVPPRLPAPWAIGGIVAFVVGALVWTRVLLQHFRKIPR